MYTIRHETGPIAVVASSTEATKTFTEVLDYAVDKLGVAIRQLKIEKTSGSVWFYHRETDPALIHEHIVLEPSPTQKPIIGHSSC